MRLLLTRRWLGYLGLTVAFAIACGLLALWQWSRNEQAQAVVDLVNDNWGASPVPLEAEVPSRSGFDPGTEWHPVELHGTYLVDDQLLVRNRVYGGSPGFEVLTPLRLDDGSVFVVDRGWLATGDTHDSPDSVPAPPRGEVTVVARLQAGEPEIPGRSAPAGQIATIHLPTIAKIVGADTYTGAYGLLDTESPSVADMPLPAVRPEPDLGPHLSYTFQWIAFGVLGFVGLGWAIRQELRAHATESEGGAGEDDERVRAPGAPRGPRPAAGRPLPPRRTRRSSAEEEDELLDSLQR